jgi:hypothetical protein
MFATTEQIYHQVHKVYPEDPHTHAYVILIKGRIQNTTAPVDKLGEVCYNLCALFRLTFPPKDFERLSPCVGSVANSGGAQVENTRLCGA